MKKNITFMLIVCMLSLLFTGCEHEYNTIPAPISNMSSSANIIPEEEIVADTISCDLTVSAPSVPYFESNNIEFTDQLTFELPFAAFCTDEDFTKIITVPGVSLEADNMIYNIVSVSMSEPDSNDYVDVTISVNSTFSYRLHEDDSVYNNSFYSYSIHRAEFELADYYTGIHFPNRTYDKTDKDSILPNLVIDNKTYSLSENATSEWKYESHNWKILDQGLPLYELPISATIVDVYTIHMPKDYDGLVMYINRNGLTTFTQNDLDNFKEMDLQITKENYVLDDCTKDSIIAIRISDILNKTE